MVDDALESPESRFGIFESRNSRAAVVEVAKGHIGKTYCNNMAFLHADADSHCIYGMQRYGPTEHAVALWGHEIAFSVLCTLPFSYA